MLLQEMLAVIAWLNNIVAERAEAIECMAIALLTRKNLFILGGTGQAKSYVINLFCKCIIGAQLFARLLTKQSDEEALFGRIDLKSYMEGNPRMITSGKIPEADVVFLDETFKCNDGVLNSMLTAMNERKWTNEGEIIDIPAISFIGASNEIPNFSDPEQEIFRPFFDRYELKVNTHDIESRKERQRLLLQKQRQEKEDITATITPNELFAMQKEVAAVTVPVAMNELMDDILCDLRRRGIHISDRKFLNYYPIVQAKAWLNGRSTVEAADLMILKNYLWTKPEEIPVIQQILEQFCINPVEERLRDIALMAAESNDEFKANVATKSTKALNKFRGELVRMYAMLIQVEADAHDKKSKTAVAKAIESLEKMSKAAHEKCNFTYAPLGEFAELQEGRHDV